MSNDTTTVKPGSSAAFKLTPKEFDNSTEVFNAGELKTKAANLDTAFGEFAKVLGEANTYVNAEVNASDNKCVFGPGYGTKLLKLWNDNASTFGDFEANFQKWAQAIAVISNKNSDTDLNIRAIYGDRGDTLSAFNEKGITTESIADMRERIKLEDAALNDFGGNSYTYYDENGNLVSIQKDASGNIVGKIVKDANGNIISATYTDSDGNYAAITYDADGNPTITYYDKDGNQISNPGTFNTDGTLTDAEKAELNINQNPTQAEIDKLGYDPTKWDENGVNRETGSLYDAEGYDVNGYDSNGYNRNGFDANGIHKDTGTEFGPDGYNQAGFDANGIHKETGTQYGPDGYDKNGYDREGFDSNGFDKSGINKETGDFYDKEGYNVDGYDKDGYNRDGWNKEGINKETGTVFDSEGYDKDGYNKEGYDRDGYDPQGYDKEGYDRAGWAADGTNKETGNGFDADGYDRDGYNSEGFNRQGYDSEGYNKEGFDRDGWNREGINQETGNEYDSEGYNKDGYDSEGYGRDGWSESGINKETGTEYDAEGYNKDGYDSEGYGRDGYNPQGYDRNGNHRDTSTLYDSEGYNADGWNKDGINRETGTLYDSEGYNIDGYNEEGYGRDGYNAEGYNAEGYGRDGYNAEGFNAEGKTRPMSVAEAGLTDKTSAAGRVPDRAEVRDSSLFGEGTREVTYQMENGEYVVAYFDKDGNALYSLVSDNPIDINGDLTGVDISNGGGDNLDSSTFKSIMSGAGEGDLPPEGTGGATAEPVTAVTTAESFLKEHGAPDGSSEWQVAFQQLSPEEQQAVLAANGRNVADTYGTAYSLTNTVPDNGSYDGKTFVIPEVELGRYDFNGCKEAGAVMMNSGLAVADTLTGEANALNTLSSELDNNVNFQELSRADQEAIKGYLESQISCRESVSSTIKSDCAYGTWSDGVVAEANSSYIHKTADTTYAKAVEAVKGWNDSLSSVNDISYIRGYLNSYGIFLGE